MTKYSSHRGSFHKDKWLMALSTHSSFFLASWPKKTFSTWSPITQEKRRESKFYPVKRTGNVRFAAILIHINPEVLGITTLPCE